MSVSAITINYYSEQFLTNLEASLKRQGVISEYFIVDNGHASDLPRTLDHTKLIENPQNLGFAVAVNQAIAQCANRWVLLVNPDIELHDGCVEILKTTAQRYSTPLVGPRFYLDQARRFKLPPALGDCAWLSCAQSMAANALLDQQQLSFYWEMRHARFWNATEPFYEPFLSGSCLLIDKQRLVEAGKLFDERYFLYYEDTDLCLHAQQQGYTPLCVPGAQAVHFFDQSPDPATSKISLMQQTKAAFFSKLYHHIPECSQLSSRVDADWHTPKAMDLGEIKNPPHFDKSALFHEQEKVYLEISLSPNFVPFAQTDFESERLLLPIEVWQRLKRGTYYARQRGEITGTHQIWRWNK
jgi:GT2 family glycosyltransferase